MLLHGQIIIVSLDFLRASCAIFAVSSLPARKVLVGLEVIFWGGVVDVGEVGAVRGVPHLPLSRTLPAGLINELQRPHLLLLQFKFVTDYYFLDLGAATRCGTQNASWHLLGIVQRIAQHFGLDS